jgi:hypothetical protein
VSTIVTSTNGKGRGARTHYMVGAGSLSWYRLHGPAQDADDGAGGGGADPAPAPAPAPAPTDPPAPSPTDPPAPKGDEWDPERARKTLETLRANEKEKDKEIARLKKIEDSLKTQEQKDKDELETLRKGKSEWDSQIKQHVLQRAIDRAVFGADVKAGYTDIVSEKLPALGIVSDPETGEPTQESLKAALVEARKRWPDLFTTKAPPADPSKVPPPPHRPMAASPQPG